MKCFVDMRWLSQSNQGVFTYLLQLHLQAEDLILRYGLDLKYFYGVESIEDKYHLSQYGLDAVVVGKRSLFWRLFLLPIYLRSNKYDYAHFQYVTPFYRLGTKFIVTTHDLLFLDYPDFFPLLYRFTRRYLFIRSINISNIVLTVSDASSFSILKHANPVKKPLVVYNSFSDLDFDTQRSKPNRPFILTVGRVEPRKNYGNLIKAFLLSSYSHTHDLVIVGFIPPEFRDCFEFLPSSPNIIFKSNLSKSELSKLYTSCNAFIYPSICEGFGIPVIDAIKFNLKVAVSSTYPLDDVRNYFFTFDPHSISSITHAINYLLSDSYIFPPVNVVNGILDNYSWSSSAHKYIDSFSSSSNAI